MDDQCPERDRCHGRSPVPVPEGGHREPINPLHLVAATLGGPRLVAKKSVGGASPGLLGTGVNVGLDLGNTGSATPSAATPPVTASPAAPAPATPAVSLPALGAVTLPTLPVLPVVTVPAAPAPTTPAPAQPTPPVLGVIGKLLGKP